MQLEGDGPERQQAAITEFCKQHGAELHEIFTEPVTGTMEGFDRPGFGEAVELISRSRKGGNHFLKRIDGIVVEKMDRLARDLMVSEIILRECRKAGIKIFATDQGALVDMTGGETEDPTRKFIRQVLGAVAELDKSLLVARMREAKKRIRAKQGKCEGAKPYGHYPGENGVLKLAISLHTGGHSLRETADLLNDGGFKTRFGKLWTKDNVYNLIQQTQ